MSKTVVTAPPIPLTAHEVQYLESLAKEQFEAARVLRAAGLLNPAASRAYYCVFALMWLYVGVTPAPNKGYTQGKWGHRELAIEFQKKYASDKGLGRKQQIELAGRIKRLKTRRVTGDYHCTDITIGKVDESIVQARSFFREITGKSI